ncbi:unnamed protein product, partial [Pylaiella littoralis]
EASEVGRLPARPDLPDGLVRTVRGLPQPRGAAPAIWYLRGHGQLFSSPVLFNCLLWHGLFAVGTLKDIHRGASQAVRYWTTTKQTPRQKGDMAFARFGFLTFTQWKDSKLVRLLSTIHVNNGDFVPIPYSKFAPGKKKETLWQPLCR